MADEGSPNRVELEFGARVDRPSIEQAKAEAVRGAEETQRAVNAAGGKPLNVAAGEAASRAAAAREAQAAADGRAAEATRRLHVEQDRLYQSVSRVNDRALELASSFGRLTNNRFGESVNRQAAIAEGQLVRLRSTSQTLRKILEDPAATPDIIARISPVAARAEQRIEQLTRRLRDLEREGQRAERRGGRDPFDLGSAARRAGAGGGGDDGDPPRGLSSATGYLAARLGIPGGVGSLTTALGVGGAAAGIGVAGAAVAGVVALTRAAQEDEKGEFNLAAAAHNTGRSFLEAKQDSDTFREALGATREDANALAAAFGQLKLRAGDALPPDAAAKLATLARAQGLEGQDAAGAVAGLAKGSAEAFEQLTGSRADVTLDRYARSIGTTTSRLSDMTKVQVLTNEALRQSADLQALAATRAESLGAKTQSFTNSLKDFAAEYGRAFVEGVIFNESAEDSYQRRLKELGIDGAGGAAAEAQARNAAARREQEAEAARQQERGFEQERANEERARAARALPESYGSGLTATGRQSAELERLRSRREALQAEFEAFKAIESQFSTDDAKKYREEFRDGIQGLTDEIRSRVEAAATEARGHVQALAKDIQNSTEEFTRLRLPTDEANPYVKLFSDGERALESLRSRFALLSQEQRETFAEQIRAAQEARRYDLEVRDAMSAVSLEFQAAELARPFEELTGAMKRTLAVFETEVKAATANPALQANANLIDARQRFRFGFNGNPRALREQSLQLEGSGAVGLNPDRIARVEFDELIRLRGQYGSAPGLGGEQIRNRLNEQISSIYGRLSPQAQTAVARDPRLSDTFAGSFREQAAFNERQIDRAARIAQAGAPSLRLAGEQLDRLRDLSEQPNANRDRTRAEFLAITGAIPREELTPDLIAGRITALREEASFKSESETRARQAFEETRRFQRAMIGENGEGGVQNQILAAIRDRNERVIVEVNNRSERATVSTLGGGFQ